MIINIWKIDEYDGSIKKNPRACIAGGGAHYMRVVFLN